MNPEIIYDDLSKIEISSEFNYTVFSDYKINKDPMDSDFMISVEDYTDNLILIGCGREKLDTIKNFINFLNNSERINWQVISLKFLDIEEDEDIKIMCTIAEKTNSEKVLSQI